MSFIPLDVNVRVLGAANAKTQLTGVGNSMQQVGTKADMMNRRLAANKSNIRGLAIGLSTVFGTITGVVAEFQLLGDAQQKVAADTALLNKLQAEGKKGTTEWSRAQASLAKDMRFLSFSTRNLALVLANFIPEAILIATSLANMRRAQALYKLQVAESIAANQGMSASNLQVAASNNVLAVSQRAVATSAIPLRNALVGQNAALAAGVAPLTNLNRSLAASSVAMNTTAVASTRLTKAFRILKIASLVLIPLVALEIGSQAFQNNWGGFADIITGIGKSIGDAVPQLKGFLDVLGKIGKSIVAIFTGDFGDIGKIWGGTAKEVEDVNEDLVKSMEELEKASAEVVLSLAEMDKKERKGSLFDLGIKGGTESRVNDVLNNINKIQQRMKGFSDAMLTIRQLNVFKDFGLKGIPDTFQKIFFTFEDRFRNIKKMFEKGSLGREIFKGLEDTMRQAAKNPGQAPEIVANYLANHPEIIDFLRKSGFTAEADLLQTQADEALRKALEKSPDTVFEDNDIGSNVLKVLGADKPNKFEQMATEIANAVANGLKVSGKMILDALATAILNTNFLSSLGATIGSFIINGLSNPVELNKQKEQFFANVAAAITDQRFWVALGATALTILFSSWTDFNQGLANISAGLTNKAFWAAVGATTLTLLFTAWTDFKQGLANIAGGLTDPVFWAALGATVLTNLFEGWTDFTTGLLKITNAIGNIEEWKAVGGKVWEGIVQGILSIPNLLGSLIDRIIGLAFQPAYGQTPTTPTPGNTGVNAPPASEDWVTWQTTVEQKIGFVWVKATAFVNYINTAFTSTIPVALQASQTAFANLAIQGANSLSILANESSSAMNGIANNFSVGEVAAQDLQTGLANLSNEGIKSMSALAKASSSMANGIKNNMKVAVAAVNSLRNAINSLKSKTVTVKVQVSNSKAEGGLMSFAEGGLMSAAKGRMFTAHGEQLVKVGDNPGGNETVAFIPHNNPYPIVDRILEMFGTRANAGGAFGRSRMGGGNNAPIIVQVYMDNQRMENHLVKTVTRRQAAFK